jgi:hypothetical protein
MYYKETHDEDFLTQYNEVAKNLKGMVKVLALSCDDFPVHCKNEFKAASKDATMDDSKPFFVIYPINPVPSYVYKLEGKLEAKKLTNRLGKAIPDNSKMLDDTSFDGWVTTERSKPKVVLYSEKETVGTLWKALSSETVFRRTVNFGSCPKAKCANTAGRDKVSKWPTIVMKRGDKAEITDHYKGEMKFEDIYNWVNLFSESGMGDQVHSASGKQTTAEEEKPWLVQEIPELHAKSHQDVCFKGGDGLCVIYAKEKGPISEEEIKMLIGLKGKFTSQMSDRGAKWKWMWIDLSVEKNYAEMFGLVKLPGVVVFNPHKRLRWTKMDEDSEAIATSGTIPTLLDKISGGDARFTPVKGQKLPVWAVRVEPVKDEKAKKDEL